MRRVLGLDAIRAICALWVVMGHFGGPPITHGFDESNQFQNILQGIYNNFWNGPAAVIVFFVVSGFCIHYPNVSSSKIKSISAFLSRRYIRIGIPLIAAIVISNLTGNNLSFFHKTILWSLAAEIIYYTLYPVLLMLCRKKISWILMFICSFICALVLAATNPMAGDYPSYGLAFNWLLGLPCWLLGCVLAENIFYKRFIKIKFIWLLRIFVWGLSICFSILRFHSPLGYPWTLNFFAIIVVVWLACEVFRYRAIEPSRFLEWMGKWSYSLYLFHPLARNIFLMFGFAKLGVYFNWLIMMSFILFFSYIFYLFVEYPAHLLARTIGRKLEQLRLRT